MADDRFIIPPTHSAPSNLTDDPLVSIVQGPGDHDEFTPAGPGNKPINPIQWGGTFNVTSKRSIVAPVISTPAFPEETDCTLILQVLTAAVTINFVITYSIGAAVFTKSVLMTQGVPKLIFLTARNIQVSALYQSSVPLFTETTSQVKVAVCKGTLKLRDFYGWTAFAQASTADASISPGIATGVLGLAHIILTAASAPGTPLWVQFFDLKNGTAPAPGATPVDFGISDTLENVGDSSSFNGMFAPEALTFSAGLRASLSTTPDTYTAVGGGNTFRIDSLIGT